MVGKSTALLLVAQSNRQYLCQLLVDHRRLGDEILNMQHFEDFSLLHQQQKQQEISKWSKNKMNSLNEKSDVARVARKQRMN